MILTIPGGVCLPWTVEAYSMSESLCPQVLAEAAEAEGKEGEKMLFNLSRFHLRISIMVHRRNFPFLVMCSAPSARGESFVCFTAYIVVMMD